MVINKTVSEMHKQKKLLAILTAILLTSLMLCLNAAAFQTDGAGNAFEVNGTNNNITVKGDYYYFFTSEQGDDTIKGSIGGDLIAMSMSLKIEAEVGGNIRGAATKFSIDNTTVKNITVAAQSLEIGENTKADSVYAFAGDVTYRGSCEYVEIWATTVYIYGNVTNGMKIHADNVYFADNCNFDKAAVDGATAPKTFDPATSEKKITDNNSILSKITYTKTENTTIADEFANLTYTLPASIILVLLLCLLAGKQIDDAKDNFRNNTGKMIGLGLAGTFLIPFAIIILLLIGYTAKIAFVLLFAYIAIALVATAFTSASIARMMMPKLNKYLSSLIGITGITVLFILSTVALLFTLFSLVYIFGNIFIKIFSKKNELPPLQNTEFQM